MRMRQLKITQSITTRDSICLEKYLYEIGKVQLISHEEEVELITRIKKGDKSAHDRLVKGNLRFVVSVAKQYQGQGIPLSDLINEGNIGLIKSVDRFDVTRGFKFISFAVWWIRQSILQAITLNSRMIRLPLNKVFLHNQVRTANGLLEQKLGRAPSVEEIAEELNIDFSDITEILASSNPHVSLDNPVSEDEDATLLDTLENKNVQRTDSELNHTESLKTEITRSMQALTDRQRETICCFFGIGLDRPMSLEDIGKRFCLTTERVRQIKDKAITKMRTAKTFDLLRNYLDS
jgi:RNA polymerase primary sigma factor